MGAEAGFLRKTSNDLKSLDAVKKRKRYPAFKDPKRKKMDFLTVISKGKKTKCLKETWMF